MQSSPWGSRTKRLIKACCSSCTGGREEKGWKAQGLKHCGVDGGKLCVCEPWRRWARSDPTAGWLCAQPTPRALGGVWRVSGNDDQNGHEKALSCSVNNYLCRHALSLTKTQSFLPPWAFTYGYWWTLFFSVFSLCGFLLHCVQTLQSYQLL